LHIFNFFGYLDPSAGSVVFQSLIGVVAGVGVFGRKVFSGFGHKVKNLFSKSESTSKSSDKS
jgi:hypothetical protein